MRFIDRAEAESVLEPKALADYLEQCHREAEAAAGDVLLLDPADSSSGASFLCRAAWRGGQALGIKFGPVMPANAGKGLPTVTTLVAVFEGETGQPLAILDGHAITNWKTAADSALGQRLLARADSRRLLIIGAGTLAPYLVRAHLAVRPSLEEVVIFNRGRPRAEALVETLAGHGIQATLAEDLESAVRAADVITTATLSERPLVRGAWLRPGTHLDLVGSYLPNMREADVEAVTAGRLAVDSYDGTIGRCGELIDAFESGRVSRESIADLYALCRQPPARSSEDITVFKNAGGGHLDLMTAEFVTQRLGLRATPDGAGSRPG